MSQKSVDIQTRAEDQHSVSSMEKALAENRRQSQFGPSSGKFKTSTSHCVYSLLAEQIRWTDPALALGCSFLIRTQIGSRKRARCVCVFFSMQIAGNCVHNKDLSYQCFHFIQLTLHFNVSSV